MHSQLFAISYSAAGIFAHLNCDEKYIHSNSSFDSKTILNSLVSKYLLHYLYKKSLNF